MMRPTDGTPPTTRQGRRHTATPPSPLAGDSGMSLVEVMVSVVILGVALTAFAATVVQSLQTITGDEQHVRATQLASEQLELLRGTQWAALGFYADDPGYSATGRDGAQTVTLGPTRPPGDTGLLPVQTVERDGITYTVEIDVVWRDDPNTPAPPAIDPDPRDYKEISAMLVWDVAGQTFSLEDSTTRRASAAELAVEEVPDCASGDIVELLVSPDVVTISSSGALHEAVSVRVETCTASSSVVLDPSPAASRSLRAEPGSGDTLFTTDSLDVGAGGFSAGVHTWVVRTAGSGGTDSATATVQVVEEGSDPLAVTGLSVEPALCVKRNGRPHRDSTLTASVIGAGGSTSVVLAWTNDAGSATAWAAGPDGSGGTLHRAVLGTAEDLVGSSTTISVTVDRLDDGASVTETFVVPVTQSANSRGCP